jgi:hypothetical protein
MARLIITTEGFGCRAIELSMGVNRLGRDEECEIRIEHTTVSTLHCELTLTNDGVYVRDCNSTNGTFINGQPTLEAWLDAGQTLRLGDVELLVETTDATIAIPKMERAAPKPPPVIFEDGALLCSRHAEQRATFQCTNCREVMCNHCVRMMRIQGGRPLFLCCLCHQKCERIAAAAPKKKKGFFGQLQDTVRLKFTHPRSGEKQ